MANNKIRFIILTLSFFLVIILGLSIEKIQNNINNKNMDESLNLRKILSNEELIYNKNFNISFSYPKFQDITPEVFYKDNGFYIIYRIGNTTTLRYLPPKLIFTLDNNPDMNFFSRWKKNKNGVLYFQKNDEKKYQYYYYFKNNKNQIIKMEYNVINGGFAELDGDKVISTILSTIRD